MKNLNKILFGILGFILIITIIARIVNKPEPISNSPKSQYKDYYTDEYTAKYAGGYTVELAEGNSETMVEAYVLRTDGSASWLWIEYLGEGKAKTNSEKKGFWSATENEIDISIQGSTGLITEKYKRNASGYFTDYSTGRYLKPNK